MSAGFWIRRKRMAAKKRLQTAETVTNTVTEENKVTEKPVKKAVQKDDNRTNKKS